MAMDDARRKRIDREAGTIHKLIALQLASIGQVNEEIRKRLYEICANGTLIATAQKACTTMQIPFGDFVLYSARQRTAPLDPEQEKKFQVAGMLSVHAQAHLFRQALEGALQE
jgi:hypothetical protein